MITIAKERASQTVDFIFQHRKCTQGLQVLLLTPCLLQDSEKQNTILRLRHFVSSEPTPARKGIALLLSEDAFTSASGKYSLNGLLALQTLMFETPAISLPVIPIPDASSFFPSIHEYMTNIEDIPMVNSTLGDSVALLTHTTSDYPRTLDEQSRNVLSDLFPSFKKLSAATRMQGGQGLLVDYLGQGTAGSVVRFWQEDSLEDGTGM
ncbi:uncharacterized protein BDV14DRAFT_104569 [Aspergillus stella-maris]|uniref:uncharacterized protein n=1 Tax=Aspergillus stella-maris TaxID=1810926 RepID=UPI003CCDB371